MAGGLNANAAGASAAGARAARPAATPGDTAIPVADGAAPQPPQATGPPLAPLAIQAPPPPSTTTKRRLQARHLQMIAIGGTIGTGLYVGSGATIAAAGPLGALVAYLIVGVLVYFITTSLGELAAHIPVSGSFSSYAGRFVDPALSFALGWNYWLQWSISLPSELAAAGIIMSFWAPNIPAWVWSAAILLLLVLVHLHGVDGFGESEYWLSAIKVAAIVVFIALGVAVDLGAVGSQPAIGFDNWSIPGAPFKNGIVGIFNVFVIAFYGFGGTELVGVTAGEAVNPRVTVPKAIRQTFWRILLFYVISIFVIGLVIRNDDPSLLNSAINNDVTTAPFTLVFERAGLSFGAHLMNAVILVAVLSASSSAMYAASRTLMAMAKEGKAPEFLGRVNGRGVPVYSLALTTLIGCLSFLSIIWGEGIIFTALLSVTGVSGILTWLSIAVIHIRFRRALKVQGVSTDILPYKAPFQPYGPYIAILLGFGIIIGQGYAASCVVPFRIWNILVVYTGIPFFLAMYYGYKWAYNTRIVTLEDCDLSGVDPDSPNGDEEEVAVYSHVSDAESVRSGTAGSRGGSQTHAAEETDPLLSMHASQMTYTTSPIR
ncbi:amino acid permease-domain-containing protein [Entophlyctis helioformis]|nr:amino acid permease-domain-containing protein [Entophlyctis helioformis]